MEAVNGRVETVLLTSETSSIEILKHHKRVNTSCIQIVDRLIQGSHKEIKLELPDVKILQVLHVLHEETIQEAISLGSSVDFILLDSGNPKAEVKTLGGTGNIHNWEISAAIVKKAQVPIFLAGGLKKENVKRAIEAVGSFGLDLCSGVRIDGDLNEAKLAEFITKVKNYSF